MIMLLLLTLNAQFGQSYFMVDEGDSPSCPASAESCSHSRNPPSSCCVPVHGSLVLALQWLPGLNFISSIAT